MAGRDGAEDLASQVLAQTAERIEDQVATELAIPTRDAQLVYDELVSGRIAIVRIDAVSRYLVDAIKRKQDDGE